MRRASASPAACATFSSPTRSRAAFVATTASVVFGVAPNGAPPAARYASASANSPSGPRAPARTRPAPSRMLPTAFSTTSAPTTTSPSPRDAHVPTPPFMARRGPSTFPTVAPVPAPTVPSAMSLRAAAHGAGGAHPALRREHHRASRGPREVGPVPHAEAAHRGKGSGGGGAGGRGRGCAGHHASAKIAWLARVVEGTYVSASYDQARRADARDQRPRGGRRGRDPPGARPLSHPPRLPRAPGGERRRSTRPAGRRAAAGTGLG